MEDCEKLTSILLLLQFNIVLELKLVPPLLAYSRERVTTIMHRCLSIKVDVFKSGWVIGLFENLNIFKHFTLFWKFIILVLAF